MEEKNEIEKNAIGENLADILMLKRANKQSGSENIFYNTSWGTKTVLGLYETIKRIMDNKNLPKRD